MVVRTTYSRTYSTSVRRTGVPSLSCPPLRSRLPSRPLAMSASLGSFVGLRRCCGASPSVLSSTAARAPRGSSARGAVTPFAGKKSDSEKPVLRPVPRAPDGTPTDVAQDLVLRPRRNRRSPTIRSAFREVCARAHRSEESDTGHLTRSFFCWVDYPHSRKLSVAALRARRRGGHPHRRHAGLQPAGLVRRLSVICA